MGGDRGRCSRAFFYIQLLLWRQLCSASAGRRKLSGRIQRVGVAQIRRFEYPRISVSTDNEGLLYKKNMCSVSACTCICTYPQDRSIHHTDWWSALISTVSTIWTGKVRGRQRGRRTVNGNRVLL